MHREIKWESMIRLQSHGLEVVMDVVRQEFIELPERCPDERMIEV
jgi:hypothetical protein